MGADKVGKPNYWRDKKRPQDTKDKMSISAKARPSNRLGKHQPESTKQLAREAKLANYQDPEFLKKMEYKNKRVSEALSNRPKSQEHKINISNSMMDHEVTQETKEAMSIGRKQYFIDHPEAKAQPLVEALENIVSNPSSLFSYRKYFLEAKQALAAYKNEKVD